MREDGDLEPAQVTGTDAIESIDRRSAFKFATLPVLAVIPSRVRSVETGNTGGTRSVKDFGAKGDGVTDDTEAFNRATRADDPWTDALTSSILVPAGRYRITGSVFVRKGQSVLGEGWSSVVDASDASASAFVLGRRRGARSRGTEDPGGAPVSFRSIMGVGGNASHGFVYVSAQGFQLRDLFLSANGLAIEIEGADGLVSDVQIDQCLSGIVVNRSQNIQFRQINFYLANFGVTLGEGCFDIGLSSVQFAYTRYASIMLASDVKKIAGIRLNGCGFTSNEAYPTFIAHIYSRASDCALKVSECTFHNTPGYAVLQDHGVGLTLDMDDCLFDGAPTNPAYPANKKSGGIRTGCGKFSIVNCDFRNLNRPAVDIGSGTVSLNLSGGEVASSADPLIARDDGAAANAIRVDRIRGLARIARTANGTTILLPDLGSGMVWEVGPPDSNPGLHGGKVVRVSGARSASSSAGSALQVTAQAGKTIAVHLPDNLTTAAGSLEVYGHG